MNLIYSITINYKRYKSMFFDPKIFDNNALFIEKQRQLVFQELSEKIDSLETNLTSYHRNGLNSIPDADWTGLEDMFYDIIDELDRIDNRFFKEAIR